MRRRSVLVGLATGVLAGCSSLAGGSRGPKQTVRSYYQFLDQGKREQAKQLVAEEGPATVISREGAAEFEAVEIEISNVEEIERSEKEATVEITYTASTEALTQAHSYRFDVRKVDSQWKIWEKTEIDR